MKFILFNLLSSRFDFFTYNEEQLFKVFLIYSIFKYQTIKTQERKRNLTSLYIQTQLYFFAYLLKLNEIQKEKVKQSLYRFISVILFFREFIIPNSNSAGIILSGLNKGKMLRVIYAKIKKQRIQFKIWRKKPVFFKMTTKGDTLDNVLVLITLLFIVKVSRIRDRSMYSPKYKPFPLEMPLHYKVVIEAQPYIIKLKKYLRLRKQKAILLKEKWLNE